MRARLRPAALVIISALALGGVVAVAAPASAVTGNADRLSVTVAGDDTVAAGDAAAVSVETYSAQGDEFGTVALPTAASGANRPFALNADEPQQGILEQSVDHSHVVLGGYATAPGPVAGGLNGTSAASVPRVVASIDAAGTVDTSTTLGNAFDGSHIRGVASTDGTHFWAGGKGDNSSPYGGVVYATDGSSGSTVVMGSGTASKASKTIDNGRVPTIQNGQLYVGSDRSGVAGVLSVGTGTPTTAATATQVVTEPSTVDTAQGYVFVGNALYVAFTDTGHTPEIVKWVENGSTWTQAGTVPGTFWGLTGRVAGDGVVLYATSGSSFGNKLVELYDADPSGAPSIATSTIATAPANREFRGVAFAAGYTPPTTAVPVPGATPTFSWTASDLGGAPSATGSLADVVGTVGTKQVSVTDPDGFPISSLAVTASSDPAVVAVAATSVTGTDGVYTVLVTPASTGRTTLTLAATTRDGRVGTSTLVVGALAAAGAGDELHLGSSDASAAVAVGDGYTLVGDDDTTAIRLYGPGGYETKAFDFASQVGIIQAGESWDTESVSQDGDTLYWLGSLGPSRKGNVKPDRDTIVETRIVGSGASTTLQYVASRHGIVSALEQWDDTENGSRFGFTEAMTSGAVVSTDHSLNVEGSAIAPNGSLWLAFRSPLVKTDGTVGTGGGTDALVVSIDNLAAMMASSSVTPHVGGAFTLDLDGRAFRDIRRTDDGNYLISAGGADDVNHWALFGWDGNPADAPVQASTVEDGRGLGGSWEGIASVPSLADGSETEIVQDDGTVSLYGDGTEAEDEASQDLKAFSSSILTLDFHGAFDAASGPGGSTGGATGGGSGAGSGSGAGAGSATSGTAAHPADPAAGTSALAFTGTDGALLAGSAALGLLLLLAGVAVRVARRRRTA
jgi:hypothetical protein